MQDPLIGQQIDRYAIRELLGSGGMARVFRAVDQSLGREVALKVVEPPRFGVDEWSARFQREAQTLAGLQHPAIVPIYTFGRHGALSYLVQELLPGPTLEEQIRAASAGGGFLPPAEVVSIIRQVAGALDYAHGRGVIHRDLKPSNLMRNSHGMLILTDFGIAKSGESLDRLTKTGMVLGTPHYLAPEQAQGQPLTPAADIYALGVLLYEAIANRVPFDDAAPLAIALAHVTQPPPALRATRPDLPPAVEDVVFTALAKAPEQRFPSAGALADALQRAWAGGPAVVASPTAALSVGRPALAGPPPAPQPAAANPAPPRHQAATAVNPALADHAGRNQSPPAARRAPRLSQRAWLGLGGAGLLLSGVIALTRREPPSVPPGLAGATATAGAATTIPAAAEPTAAPTAADPFAQAEAILAQAAANKQADPKTAAGLLKKLGELEEKLAAGNTKDADKLRADLARQISEAEREEKLAAAPAAELWAALAPLGIDPGGDDDDDDDDD